MGTYATYTDVAAELGGVSITASTTPSSTVVDGWVQDAEAEVELLSGQVYATTAISSTVWEYHTYDGSGVIRLNKYPVQTVQVLQAEQNGPGSATEDWQTLAGPGRTDDYAYELYSDVGAVRFHPNSLSYGPKTWSKGIRVAYTYGATSVPRTVKQLVVKLAAKRYIESVSNNTSSTGGGSISVGAISISDPSNYVTTHLTRIDKEIERLQNQVVGSFRVVNYEVGLYD